MELDLDALWPVGSPYLALARTFVQSMPEEWQQRFAGCLLQLNEKVDDLETPVKGYVVQAVGEDQTMIQDPHADTGNGERRLW